jgi:hypothetical protein
MAKKRGKSVSFDAMVKFFMNTYDIPTKRDLVMLINRLDRIERLVLNSTAAKGKQGCSTKAGKKSGELSASGIVLEIIQRYGDGVGLAEIQLQSGFGEKKLRNILFRLHKEGKITRISRGIYTAA